MEVNINAKNGETGGDQPTTYSILQQYSIVCVRYKACN